jgi:hypothetical protein
VSIDLSTVPLDLDAGGLPVGTVLKRWYCDQLHTVYIREPLSVSPEAEARGWWRYEYAGERYKTLSAIAFRITGDRYMSGNRFFGLRKRRRSCRKPKIP